MIWNSRCSHIQTTCKKDGPAGLGCTVSSVMNSIIQDALDAPLLVLNSFGFSGAEALVSLLASHNQIGLLPGQNFIEQEHTLYRPIRLPSNDASACFELLSTKQYTKAGVQWAGLGKFMAAEYAERYSISAHKKRFIEHYARLNDSEKSTFTRLIKLYTHSFFECMGDDTSAFSHYGFYGSNLLLTASAYPEFHTESKVLQVKPSVAQWLALASQTRTWNPEKALNFYIIQNLFIALCEKSQDNIHSITYSDLITDTRHTINSCCDFLGISPWHIDAETDIDFKEDINSVINKLESGMGHPPITQAFIDKILDDTDKINTIYANSPWFEVANSVNDWAGNFLDDENAVALLEKYRRYWNTTSHIAFDWSGPLENQLIQLIEQHSSCELAKRNISNQSIAYQFYQQWYKLNSIDHYAVAGNPMFPLGEIEAEIPVPKLQYFMRIAIHYIQSSVALQGEKLHSYHSANNSHLYKTLCSDDMQLAIDRLFLHNDFDEMQATVDHTETLFHELKESGIANAAKFSMTGAADRASIITGDTITDKEINAISISGPDITEHENKLVMAAMSDWYQQPYFYCEEFESRFAAYHNRNHALMTPSCTTAHHLLLMGLGIGPGDEVLVPEATWIASAAPIYYTGATPIYCDIDADDWCISIESMRNNLSANTRAIVAVNLYGNMAKMDKLEQFAKEYNLLLIEDAAESVGSVYKTRKSGEFGVGSLFSFHRTKTITTGEGGMLLVDDKALFERCVKLRDHGRGPDTQAFTHELVTHKYMPFNVQAALGLAQFDRLDQLVDKKRHILQFYKQRLARFDNLQLNAESDDVYNSAWCSTIVLGHDFSYTKASLMSALLAERIPSRPFFYPLSTQPAIQSKLGGNVDFSMKNSTAFAISDRGVNLPSALNLTDTQLDYVCTVLEKLLDADLAGFTSRHKKAA